MLEGFLLSPENLKKEMFTYVYCVQYSICDCIIFQVIEKSMVHFQDFLY